MSQEDLAERAGVSVRTISDIERGVVRRARRNSLDAIANALGLSEQDRAALFTHHRGGATPQAIVPERADPEPPVPCQLPPDTALFTGRHAYLRQLDAWLRCARDGARIVIVDGPAGVGKTTLAVHWAHRIRGQFPDGQLFVDLRGYGPTEPLDTEALLEQLLLGTGVPAERIPAGLQARAGLLRSRTADRRLLLLLDDVRRPDQVRSALPSGQGCVVLITSRSRLRGLAVREGAKPLTLDELTDTEGLDLLSRFIGADRVRQDQPAALGLVRLCARLPLAVGIVADRAARLPWQALGDLMAQLSDEGAMLDELHGGDDLTTNLNAVFSWSYRTLPQQAARLFRLLGLHPGPDLDRYAAAALAGLGAAAIGPVLDSLVEVHLLEQRAADRYQFHELLRLYAARLSVLHDDPAEQRAALSRLFDHYRYATSAAMDHAFPHERHRRPRVCDTTGSAPPMPDAAAARAWLDRERRVLAAMIAYCARRGWPGHAVDLAGLLWRYLDAGAHYHEAITIHSHAHAAARVTGDLAAEGNAAHNLGAALWRSGQYEQAFEQLERALTLRRETGDLIGAGDTLTNLSGLNWRLGRYERAAEHLRIALEIRRELGNRSGEAGTLDNLGVICERLGRYQDALTYHRQALEIFREVGNRSGEAAALDNLGVVYRRLGRHAEAAAEHRQAMEICRAHGFRLGEGYTLANLAAVLSELGDQHEAAQLLERALEIRAAAGDRAGQATALSRLAVVRRRCGQYTDAIGMHERAVHIGGDLGDRQLQIEAMNSLAETYRVAGDWSAAIVCHRHALRLALRTDDRYEQARALDGLGRAWLAGGRADRAYERCRRAGRVYAALGSAAADGARALITDLRAGGAAKADEASMNDIEA